ncbi:MAG: CBS domain-containing protein [Gammaproteobacteria bacterium]|jgi:magnesium and cobalt transporter|nr:CBS domain-containing protein [Gammaproteobacteria bacterium]MBT3858931.1 CBS domain-containing protein [Gammaproteobacteria bacterium]MBT3988259.1 CBS domain-containing protein [Gammaproteobacteria bacterium]MBT4256879.1 CBS domain-containing protein [Gammaproteobacteria bacterium]MBT4582529.1 CBS domain-containing protein [Gammaproteobacteria bacterium]
MTDDDSSIDSRPRSWIDKLAQFFSDEPTDTKSLLELVRNAEQDQVLDADALAIIEGALQVSSMQVRDIMIPRSQVVTVEASLPITDIIELITKASHSRFPVTGESVDNVMGILLAKDLLPLILAKGSDKFNIKDVVRPATFVPESKRLNVLLKEFRETRQHMALVIDEYGSVCGAVTIEDVLEQIVGEIEDEHDVDDDSYIKKFDEENHIVKALTPVDEFNDYFHTEFSDQEFTTIGGLVLQKFGHIPERGESVNIGSYLITVLNADSRQIKLIKVTSSPANQRR